MSASTMAPEVLPGILVVGGYPGDDYKSGQLFATVDNAKKTEDFVAAALWLKSRADCTGKIGVTDFCYGGSTSNTLAVRLGADLAAAAPFYGSAPAAVHGFNNDATPERYNKAAADEAWQRTISWFNKYVRA